MHANPLRLRKNLKKNKVHTELNDTFGRINDGKLIQYLQVLCCIRERYKTKENKHRERNPLGKVSCALSKSRDLTQSPTAQLDLMTFGIVFSIEAASRPKLA